MAFTQPIKYVVERFVDVRGADSPVDFRAGHIDHEGADVMTNTLVAEELCCDECRA